MPIYIRLNIDMKMYDCFYISTETINFNNEPIGIKTKIPKTGKVIYHTKNFPDSSTVAQYSTIHLCNVTLSGGQGLILQL